MTSLISFTVFLIYMNVPAVMASQHGVPKPLAFLVPLLLAVPVAHRVLLRGEPLRFPGMIFAALLMLACHAVSALLSERPHLGMEIVFSWLAEGVFLAFLMVNALRDRKEVFIAARAIVAAGAVMGLVVLVQQILGPVDYDMAGFGQIDSQDLEREQLRLAGPIGEKNRFAQIMAVLIPLAGGLGMTAPAGKRWPYGVALLLICTGVALSFSRGAILALVLVIPFALAYGLLRLRHLVMTGLLGAILIAAAPFMSAMPYLTARIASIGEVAVQSLGLKPGGFRNADGASRGRITEMQAAGLLFLDHPLLGAGPAMAPQYYADYAILVGGKVRTGTRRSHSLYLQLAAETGVVGLLAFCGVIAMTFFPLDAARRRTQFSDRKLWGLLCGLQLGLLIFLATSVFLHAAYVRYCWLLLGLAVAAAALPCRAIRPEYFNRFKLEGPRSLARPLRTVTAPPGLERSGG